MVVVKRALISCADKTGLEAFAKGLAASGVELIASGGTAQVLRTRGLRVTTVEQFAGITEQLDGRVKTLHPKMYAGILARRDDPAHVKAVGKAGLIDLVVVNLYPFERTVQREGATEAEAVEQIDIGGVSLLRAAAKNFAHVAAVCRPDQYATVLAALRRGKGRLPEPLVRQLALAAFRLTSDYDTAIAAFFTPRSQSLLPEVTSATLRIKQLLRYGENPHQRGGWYVRATGTPWGLGTLRQLQGKELSYNNLLDMDAALRCLLDVKAPSCAIIKHRTLCGLASADALRTAYARAHACDPESAFGGIVGCNRPVDKALAAQLTQTFLEIVMAPAFAPAALTVFRKKPNLRVLTIEWPSVVPETLEWRELCGAWLIQDSDCMTVHDLRTVVTKRAPTKGERAGLEFAWKAAKHALSNAVVLANDHATLAIGQGQPSRVGAVRLAIEKGGERLQASSQMTLVAASDGFFPFPDSIELLAGAGVRAVIQPGGSKRDAEVIAAADQAGIAMICTGVRHFRH